MIRCKGPPHGGIMVFREGINEPTPALWRPTYWSSSALFLLRRLNKYTPPPAVRCPPSPAPIQEPSKTLLVLFVFHFSDTHLPRFLLEKRKRKDEGDHQHPHRPGRDPSGERLLGALLPRARHPARWHHAEVSLFRPCLL